MSESGASNTGSPQDTQKALVGVAIESWKLSRLAKRVISKLDVGEQSRFVSHLSYSESKLANHFETLGLRVVDLEGQPFEPGTAATPVNIAEFEIGDLLVIEQALEPTLLGAEGLVHAGAVILRKVNR